MSKRKMVRMWVTRYKGHGSCAFNTAIEAAAEVEDLLKQGAGLDEVVIVPFEISARDKKNMPEFPGW